MVGGAKNPTQSGMTPDELEPILIQALAAKHGVYYSVKASPGLETKANQQALAAIQAKRRAMIANYPDLINYRVKLLPAEGKIAIFKVGLNDEEQAEE